MRLWNLRLGSLRFWFLRDGVVEVVGYEISWIRELLIVGGVLVFYVGIDY